jgi:translation initiation factor 1
MSDSKPFHNPFEALRPLREGMPDSPSPEPQPSPVTKPSRAKGPARAVVRMERTGRGGKEVTVIDHLGLPPAAREQWLKALKAALGCGGVVEEDRLVLQGDQRKRLPALLSERGVRKVTVA